MKANAINRQNLSVTLRINLLLIISTTSCFAGMPSFNLSDVYRLRFQDISFFVFLIIVCAVAFKLLWNYIAKAFPFIPTLNFKRSLALVFMLGLAMLLVLTMISGIRELLTPEAWRHQGATYRLNDPAQEPARLRSIEHLRTALFDYARVHDGEFPLNDFTPDISDKIWESPDQNGTRYIYAGAHSTHEPDALLAIEPLVFGDKRFVLRGSGKIEKLTTSEINQLAGRKANK